MAYRIRFCRKLRSIFDNTDTCVWRGCYSFTFFISCQTLQQLMWANSQIILSSSRSHSHADYRSQSPTVVTWSKFLWPRNSNLNTTSCSHRPFKRSNEKEIVCGPQYFHYLSHALFAFFLFSSNLLIVLYLCIVFSVKLHRNSIVNNRCGCVRCLKKLIVCYLNPQLSWTRGRLQFILSIPMCKTKVRLISSMNCYFGILYPITVTYMCDMRASV